MPEPLRLTATSAVSGRTAMVAEEVDSVWLYLTAPHSKQLERDCWLFNTPSAPADPDFAAYRAQSAPPPAPASYILSGAVRKIPNAERWTFKWSPDGDAVVAAVDGVNFGMVSARNAKGVSRFLAQRSPWGSPWDEDSVASALL